MNLKVYALCGAFSFCSLLNAQQMRLQPTPQHVSETGRTVTLPAGYRLVGAETADPQAVELLRTLLPGEAGKKGYPVYIGEKNDKALKKYARFVPDRPEGYYLAVDDQKIVLAGNDERGTYYAVQTLARLLDGQTLPAVKIEDYPDIRFRGVVEGFYGEPWSFDDRVSQLKFYGANKLNTYIYGPKDDPYHSSPNWRLPYPEKEAAELAELVRVAAANKVDFVWAIHPGQDIRWNDTDRDLLLAKFEKMYELGVRSFAVFFDDISGDGTDPVRQAELLNYIDDRFVKVKPDVTPLIMCPTEYNKAWSNPNGNYLTTLGKRLNPSVQIMWTGDRVISDMNKPGLDWINERIRRPAYIWWNFPVSDYVRNHLLLGPVYGNETTLKNDMAGFVANPMERAEASKIAIYGVADYAWNLERYDSDAAWKGAIREILPNASGELLTFASHNSDLGPNGHRYRRDESVALKPVANRFLDGLRKNAYAAADYEALRNEFERIAEAADILLVNKDNPALIQEIGPWLYQSRLQGETGGEVLAMLKAFEQNDTTLFLRKYKHVRALKEQSFAIDQGYNQNPYQPGVKTGTLVLEPLIDSVFVWTTTRYNAATGSELNTATWYCPHRLTSDVAQLKHLPLQIRNNRVAVSPLLEVVKWPAGGSVVIELDRAYPLLQVAFNLGAKDAASWSRLEVSSDGQNWEALDLQTKQETVTADGGKKSVKAVRLTLPDHDREVYWRQFTLVLEK